MKKIILFIAILALFVGCKEEVREYSVDDKTVSEVVIPKYDFKSGDIVYIKPDSTKVVFEEMAGDESFIAWWFDSTAGGHSEELYLKRIFTKEK